MPDREALIMKGPETMDSGLMLEQDRTSMLANWIG
jgi:hypothetical protein